ncbi:MAG TPA: L-ribulose-5-phosphate 4-epimerase AraD [Armatimonadota bacterium]|jgi:L-ribulose-5-phosphate 4-epimerase
MTYQDLRESVWEANMGLANAGLAVLTWGNASGVDRRLGVMAIKPSGVPYSALHAEDIVVLALDTGQTVDGAARPSSDTPTHLEIYRAWPEIGGVTHTHSVHAAIFAQAMRDIPCFGTTHADAFHGPVPTTRPLTEEEIRGEYEANTGKVILECFAARDIVPAEAPGVLVAQHGPFTWGATPMKALEAAVTLETIAQMALSCLALNPALAPIPDYLLDKHYLRKHGPGAYYGQKTA